VQLLAAPSIAGAGAAKGADGANITSSVLLVTVHNVSE
jgi:hypothetical protein